MALMVETVALRRCWLSARGRMRAVTLKRHGGSGRSTREGGELGRRLALWRGGSPTGNHHCGGVRPTRGAHEELNTDGRSRQRSWNSAEGVVGRAKVVRRRVGGPEIEVRDFWFGDDTGVCGGCSVGVNHGGDACGWCDEPVFNL
ncbi:vegetative cell wall protein gp1-like [Iris pallida]|uniref:Vegetative cell wall protein gp1-like n=1 Tax=Iris pallida TaxID=29817 RepID=A0AAX6E7P6_IRIPA|nr:vegetative cell wall protein gp1-like [Iris pallida]